MTNTPGVGWIGAGKMGSPMSRRLVEAGFPVKVFEPNTENFAAALAFGAAQAQSLGELAAQCQTIFLTIPDDQALRAVMLGGQGLARLCKRGQTLVEMSTVSPQLSAEVADALARQGVNYLRAPVSGSTAAAAAGKLTVLASGPRASFEACEPMLACFSIRRFYVGPGEEARYLKLVLNSLVGATSALLAEALSLGRSGNLSVKTMLDVICESAVASPLIGYKRDMLLAGDYAPAFSVRQMMKDFDLILDAAHQGHVPMQLAAEVRGQLALADKAGNGERDFFVLAEQHRRQADALAKSQAPA
jgi:3-hydroxyisobutyrate dehydrogenase-like beta-hydroxyacid dehydrogenase